VDLLTVLGPIVQNVLIVCALSMFLLKRSILSDIAEQTFVSTSIAMFLTAAIDQIRANGLTPLFQGKMIILMPLFLGVLIYTQFWRKYAFLQRWSMALVIGVGLGIVIRTAVETTIMRNFVASILPVTEGNLGNLANNSLMIVAVICTVSYFLFTRPRTGALGRVQHLGRYFMMIFFGASFGSFVMDRLSSYLVVLQAFLRNFGIVP
jgi:hypothetical protein